MFFLRPLPPAVRPVAVEVDEVTDVVEDWSVSNAESLEIHWRKKR